MGVFEIIAATLLSLIAAFGIPYLLWRAITVRTRRRSCERMVVGQLAAVVRLNLPMAPALRMAAQEEPRRVRARLAAISALLAQGQPLSTAVRTGYPECSGLVLSMIQAGERSGQLHEALRATEHMLIERDRAENQVDAAAGPYSILVLAVILSVVTMIMVVVIPKFEEIFVDFDTRLPSITVVLIDLAQGLGQLFSLLLGVFLLAVPSVIYWRIRPRRPEALQWTAQIADTVRWRIPGLRRMQLGAGMSIVFRALGFARRSGMTLAQAATTVAELDVNLHLRERMRRFAARLAAGDSAGEAARAANLGNAAIVALASGQRTGNFDAALRYVADYHAGLVSRSWMIVQRLVFPLCTLILAMLVAVVVYALFLPLIMLIQSIEVW